MSTPQWKRKQIQARDAEIAERQMGRRAHLLGDLSGLEDRAMTRAWFTGGAVVCRDCADTGIPVSWEAEDACGRCGQPLGEAVRR